MKKQMLIFLLVAAVIFTIVLATVESVSAQNGAMGGNACMSCGPTNGTNLTNATKGGNVTNDNLSNPLLDKKVDSKATMRDICLEIGFGNGSYKNGV